MVTMPMLHLLVCTYMWPVVFAARDAATARNAVARSVISSFLTEEMFMVHSLTRIGEQSKTNSHILREERLHHKQ